MSVIEALISIHPMMGNSNGHSTRALIIADNLSVWVFPYIQNKGNYQAAIYESKLLPPEGGSFVHGL
jgi:hypothetical protein